MKFFSSSSYYVGLLAQNKLLTALTKIPYETKYECNTNFIEIRRNKTKPLKEQKTLLLMHGFGSGLGFFFRKFMILL